MKIFFLAKDRKVHKYNHLSVVMNIHRTYGIVSVVTNVLTKIIASILQPPPKCTYISSSSSETAPRVQTSPTGITIYHLISFVADMICFGSIVIHTLWSVEETDFSQNQPYSQPSWFNLLLPKASHTRPPLTQTHHHLSSHWFICHFYRIGQHSNQ